MDALRALRILGLPPGATPDDIQAAWRDLAKVWHPDRFAHDERLRDKASVNLQRINEAHDALRDYDPHRPVGVRARVRESIAIVLGMGELGEPPPVPSEPAAAQAAPPMPLGPIRIRKSVRVLGLGMTYRVGERRRRSHAGALLLGAGLILLALLVAVLSRWFG